MRLWLIWWVCKACLWLGWQIRYQCYRSDGEEARTKAMNFKTLAAASLAALLLLGGQVQATQVEVTSAIIGRGAYEVAKTGIPMTRAMQIAVGATKGTTISLAGVTTFQEIRSMTWQAAR